MGQGHYDGDAPINYQYQFGAMTVNCQLMLVGTDQAQLHQAAVAVELQTMKLHHKYNFYDQDSWLNKTINQRQLSSVVLDKETADILAKVRTLTKLTQGQFDICVGTLKWPEHNFVSDHIEQRQAQYQTAMGLKAWSLDSAILRFNHQATRIDLGGVVKEYAVDQAMIICQRLGVKAGLINFGGDCISWGYKADKQAFRVALQHPLQKNKMCASIALTNQALTTSGHTQRHLILGEQRYSHLIGTKVGQILSVSVISNSALTSGIFSTALSINPKLGAQIAIKKCSKALFLTDELKLVEQV